MNKIEYKDISAFHPGYYILEIIEDMEISQKEFAVRLGTTPKTVSELVRGECNLSNDLARKVSSMLGTSVEVWLNLQKTYDQKMIEIEQRKQLDEQICVMADIDYSYFVRVAKLPNTRSATEKVSNLCRFLQISNLNILRNQDFLVNFRSSEKNIQEKNVINARAWLQTAINIAKNDQARAFNAQKLNGFLPEIRKMTTQPPEDFYPRLCQIFNECGVSFVLLPHLKNSKINGAVKWIGRDKVVLAMNDRCNYADIFWFSLFHEIKHVLQQKVKMTFVSASELPHSQVDASLEEEADCFAQEYLIPSAKYEEFVRRPYFSDSDIVKFAQDIGIHPGIVAGRLQHDRRIAPNRCAKLKARYKIALTCD